MKSNSNCFICIGIYNIISNYNEMDNNCTHIIIYKEIFSTLNKFVTKPTLLTDVGSTKMSVINDFKENLLTESKRHKIK